MDVTLYRGLLLVLVLFVVLEIIVLRRARRARKALDKAQLALQTSLRGKGDLVEFVKELGIALEDANVTFNIDGEAVPMTKENAERIVEYLKRKAHSVGS